MNCFHRSWRCTSLYIWSFLYFVRCLQKRRMIGQCDLIRHQRWLWFFWCGSTLQIPLSRHCHRVCCPVFCSLLFHIHVLQTWKADQCRERWIRLNEGNQSRVLVQAGDVLFRYLCFVVVFIIVIYNSFIIKTWIKSLFYCTIS